MLTVSLQFLYLAPSHTVSPGLPQKLSSSSQTCGYPKFQQEQELETDVPELELSLPEDQLVTSWEPACPFKQ